MTDTTAAATVSETFTPRLDEQRVERVRGVPSDPDLTLTVRRISLVGSQRAPSREAFRRLAERAPLQLLEWMAELPSPDLAIAAEFAGAFAGANASVRQALLQLLHHDDPHVKSNAIHGLGHHADEEVIKAFRSLIVREQNTSVKEIARDVLELAEQEREAR